MNPNMDTEQVDVLDEDMIAYLRGGYRKRQMGKIPEKSEEQKAKERKASADSLARRLNEIYPMTRAPDISVSNAYPVLLTEEVQETYKVGPFARKVVTSSGTEVHAGPRDVDTTPQYKSEVETYISRVEELVAGGRPSWSFSEVPESKLIKEKEPDGIVRYERGVIEQIISRQGIAYLINPSIATVWAAERLNYKIVAPKDYRYMYKDVLAKQNRAESVSFSDTAQGWVYLGANGPKGCTQYAKWMCLWINPYNCKKEGNFEMSIKDLNVTMRYQRKNREVSVVMPAYPEGVRYSSTTTDILLKQGMSSYLLESSHPLTEIRSDSVGYGDLWLPPFPAVQAGKQYIEDAELVWDVPGGGTYMSRRREVEAYALTVKKQPAPLLQKGSVNICYDTEQLRYCQLRKVDQGFATFPIAVISPKPIKTRTTVRVLLVSQDTRGLPIDDLPGLYHTFTDWDPETQTLHYTSAFDFVALRDWGQVGRYQLAIVQFLLRDTWPHIPSRGLFRKEFEVTSDVVASLSTMVELTPVPTLTSEIPKLYSLHDYSIFVGLPVRVLARCLKQDTNIILGHSSPLLLALPDVMAALDRGEEKWDIFLRETGGPDPSLTSPMCKVVNYTLLEDPIGPYKLGDLIERYLRSGVRRPIMLITNQANRFRLYLDALSLRYEFDPGEPTKIWRSVN